MREEVLHVTRVAPLSETHVAMVRELILQEVSLKWVNEESSNERYS